jgi:hypothetical protein
MSSFSQGSEVCNTVPDAETDPRTPAVFVFNQSNTALGLSSVDLWHRYEDGFMEL